MRSKSSSTSWNPVGKWYNDAVGEQGHYYHQAVVLPNLLRILNLSEKEPASLLDIACGQGVLSRHIPKNVSYVGIDAAAQLIAAAKTYSKLTNHRFLQSDATKEFPLKKEELFTHGAIVLAIQNIEEPLKVFKNAAMHLIPGAQLVVVMNHPCFRIPRQSSWKVDPENKTQYRRIDRYMSDMKIPIQTNPSKGKASTQSWSFHHPLSAYTKWLHEAGFTIDLIEEWCSDKVSEGKAAKMENRSREEIPMFMTIVARKR